MCCLVTGTNGGCDTGGVSVAVPSELKLLDYLYRHFGSGNLTWYELLEPTINFTRDGFPMHQYLFDVAARFVNVLGADPVLNSTMFGPNRRDLLRVVREMLSSFLLHQHRRH